jgi:DNA polymerase
MIHAAVENNFGSWRKVARSLLAQDVSPDAVVWSTTEQGSLFEGVANSRDPERGFHVPAKFLTLAEAVACYDSERKWDTLYRLLFRIENENRHLLQIETDPDVRQAALMEKAVRRDVHKFHAFVRFRMVEIDGEEIYIAWHEPQHFTVERATPFFARRFGNMRFSILTPKGCAHWDRKALTFSPPANRGAAPDGDATEEFWLAYYRSIFNPFRLKVRAMKKELPVRHWVTLPEAILIPELIRDAESRGRRTN